MNGNINIENKSRKKNIEERNQKVLEGKGGGDYLKWKEPNKIKMKLMFGLI